MLKKAVFLITLTAALIMMAGCRVVLVNQSLEEKEPPEIAKGKEEIMLDASVQYSQKRLVIRGQTSLPQRALVQGGLKDAGTPEEFIAEEKAEVAEDGTFLIVIKRPDINTRYELSVRFTPEIQPPEIQEKYGQSGELIGASDGLYEYDVNGTPAKGIVKFAPLGSVEEAGYWLRGKYSFKADLKDSRPMR